MDHFDRYPKIRIFTIGIEGHPGTKKQCFEYLL